MLLREGEVHRWSKGRVSRCPESLGFIGNAVISFIHSEKKKPLSPTPCQALF